MIIHRSIRRLRRRMRESKPWTQRAMLALIIALLHLFAFESDEGSSAEPVLMDTFFRLRGPLPPPEAIVIVSIDERSYRELGLSTLQPIPRRRYEEILSRLKALGVESVFLDFVFRSRGEDPEGDSMFAESLKLLPVFLGKYVRYTRQTGLDGRKVELEEWVLPLEPLAKSAAGVLPLSLALDGRTVRRFYFPTAFPPTPGLAPGVCRGRFICTHLPTPEDFINFYGPPGTLKRLSLADLLRKDGGDFGQLLRGKIIFLGNETLTQTGIENRDAFLTPFAEGMTFGVEIHATAAGNLLDQHWIRRLDPRLEITALNISLFLTAFLAFGFRPAGALAVVTAAGTAWFSLSYALFTIGYFLPGVLFLSVFLPGILVLSALHHAVSSRRSLHRLRSALGIDTALPE